MLRAGFSYNIVHTCICTRILPPPSLICPLKFLSGTGYYINKVWPTFTLILMATLRSFLYSNAFKASNWSYLVCRGFRNRCFVNSPIPSASGKSFSPIPESILKSKVFCSSEMHLPYTRKYLASLLFVRFYFYFWGGTTTLF